MNDQFTIIPQEMKERFLNAYLHGDMLFCEFSFPRSVYVGADKAVGEVVACLRRCAKKTGVAFRIVATGNLSRQDTQIHFHIIVLPVDADAKGVERLKDALQRRWAFVANKRHHPTKKTLQQGFSIVSSQDEYWRKLNVPEVEGNCFQSTAYKWAYNLRRDKNDWLFCEDDRLGLDTVYAKRKIARRACRTVG